MDAFYKIGQASSNSAADAQPHDVQVQIFYANFYQLLRSFAFGYFYHLIRVKRRCGAIAIMQPLVPSEGALNPGPPFEKEDKFDGPLAQENVVPAFLYFFFVILRKKMNNCIFFINSRESLLNGDLMAGIIGD